MGKQEQRTKLTGEKKEDLLSAAFETASEILSTLLNEFSSTHWPSSAVLQMQHQRSDFQNSSYASIRSFYCYAIA
jgi:hypothetical protein